VNQHAQTHHHEWTVHRQDAFFSLGSCSPGNLPIDDSSKKCAKGSKIGVHPTGWPQNTKMGVVCLWVLGHTSQKYQLYMLCSAIQHMSEFLYETGDSLHTHFMKCPMAY